MRHWKKLLGVVAIVALASSGAIADDEAVIEAAVVDVGAEVEASGVDPTADVVETADAALAEEVVEADESELDGEVVEADEVEDLALEESAASSDDVAHEDDSLEEQGFLLDAEVGSTTSVDSPAGITIPSSGSSIVLGPEAMDTQGRIGRVHTVARGDTLWDVSEAYLGTAWVWPSIWEDNRVIDDPHQISPGDRIWISSTLMRRLTDEEAESFIGADINGGSDTEVAIESAPADGLSESDDSYAAAADEEDLGDETDAGAGMQDLPVSVPDGDEIAKTGKRLPVSWVESLSILRGDVIEASTSIVGSALYRTFYAQGDEVYVGLSEDGVAVGDEYSFYREERAIHDLSTGSLLGYHVQVLGWGKVTEIHSETAVVHIRQSVEELAVGDRLVPRVVPETEFELRSGPPGFEGEIVYLPDDRAEMGMLDYVYVNRGAVHGIEPGMELEVYEMGGSGVDGVKRSRLQLPDIVTANLVVVRVAPDTSVALVTESTTEVELGNIVRSRTRELVRR